MTDKIFLGRTADGRIYLEKHKWDCSWYWAFGYIGNQRTHFHIRSMIDHPADYRGGNWSDLDQQFESTWLNQSQWWILRDLFIQAYALKKAAECYQYGGHQTGAAKPYGVQSERQAAKMAGQLNTSLEYLLDRIYSLIQGWKQEIDSTTM